MIPARTRRRWRRRLNNWNAMHAVAGVLAIATVIGLWPTFMRIF